jgi:hypothetical protein
MSNKSLCRFLAYIEGKNSLTSVVLSGGEPLPDPRLRAVIEACREEYLLAAAMIGILVNLVPLMPAIEALRGNGNNAAESLMR